MSKSLEQRIAAALGDGAITSSALGDLIAETDKAAAASAAESDPMRAKALDVEQEVDLSTVHAAMEKAALNGDRLRAAMPRLWALFDQVASQEYATQWRVAYDEAAIVRDKLAEELVELYGPFVGRLTDLITRIESSEQQAAKINSGAPRGVGLRLLAVELSARNLAGFTRAAPSILEELKLPPWQPGGPEWPMARPFNAAVAAACAPRPHNPRYSSDWAAAKEAEAAERREQQRLETEKREAEANANWHGPKWWLGGRA
jgi:hypothetical protein